MKFKNIITVCLILVLTLQLLPVKQAVRYFFTDTTMVEEIMDVNKNATKNFRILDEDHCFFSDVNWLHPHFYLSANTAFFHYAETIPPFHAADIHTPPPNNFL